MIDPEPPQRNPEQDVVDDIDRLVTETMRAGRRGDAYESPEPKCPVCGSGWHGLRGDGSNQGKMGCPGEYGSDLEKYRWRKDYDLYLENARQRNIAKRGKVVADAGRLAADILKSVGLQSHSELPPLTPLLDNLYEGLPERVVEVAYCQGDSAVAITAQMAANLYGIPSELLGDTEGFDDPIWPT